MSKKRNNPETIAIYGDYRSDPATSVVYRTTSYQFQSTGIHLSCRVMNPTNDVLEKRVAALD